MYRKDSGAKKGVNSIKEKKKFKITFQFGI